MKIKGVSPLISSILLIAFSVAVGGLISVWITGFTATQTETVSTKSSTQLMCKYGGVSLKDLKYDCNTDRLAGIIENTGTIAIGNISIQIIFKNASSVEYKLWETIGNISYLRSGALSSFNFSTAQAYDKVRVITNCSSVYHEVESGDVTTSNC